MNQAPGAKLSTTGPYRPPALPAPLTAAVELAWERFIAAGRQAGVEPPANPELLQVLRRVWAYSTFLPEHCIADPALLNGLLRSGDLLLDYRPDSLNARVRTALAGIRGEEPLATALRRLRQREMVRIAWRDLAGWAGLEQTLHELSWLAATLVDGALDVLHRLTASELGAPHGAESGAEQRLVVLGMGKLGAHELNFSSDIDLIFAYPEAGETTGRRRHCSNEEFFQTLGARLVRCLNTVTAEGFVFRVDLRLRPYGQSGPLVMSFDQMEDYYQSQGREWERYAMIKARPVAGDLEQGRSLMQALHPFVYRRYLDFGVFESLREMKSMIDGEVARRELRDNIKLGPGGIREVEFIGQTFQLVRGGREPELQTRGILDVLAALTAAGHLPEEAGRELAEAYRFLRRLENRLQMYADQQTHEIPEQALDRLRLAAAMGFPDWDGCAAALESHRRRVQRHFESTFLARPGGKAARAMPETGAAPDYEALWQGRVADAEAQALLARAGFDDAVEALRHLRLLRDGYTYRALSEQGRARMDHLLPLLLAAVAAAAQPAGTLVRLLNLLERIARRTAYLALLTENPMVLTQLVKLCEASPWIAAMLTGQPLLLDELIDPRTLYAPLDRAALERELRDELAAVSPDDLEQQMEALRHFKQANVLRVAAADIAGVMPLMVVSDHLTEIAEVVLVEVLGLAARHLAQRRRPAQPPGWDFAIIAYGKLGGIELGYGSDLDLVFLHGGGDDAETTPYSMRLGQRIIHLLSAHTPSGVLYEADVRLRPSGASGLLVSAIDAFEDYQRHQAWTWEHQALVRARVIAGDPLLARRFDAVRAEVLARPRDPAALREEVRSMRERMRAELARGGAQRFDLKQDRGGIADIEFLVQYLVLRWAHEHKTLLRWTDNIRLLQTLAEAGLLPAAEAALLTDAYRAYRRRAHRLALQEERAVVEAGEFDEHRAGVSAIWQRIMEAAVEPPLQAS